MKLLAIVLAAGIAAGGLYVWARLHRYEISHGGSQRYFVVVKLDRWTGRAWKMQGGATWAEIDLQKKADPPALTELRRDKEPE